METYSIKSIDAGTSVSDVDTATGTVSGYFSIFGNIDHDKDMVTKGAYSNTLKMDYGRILHLWGHNTEKPLSSTRQGLTLNEDNKGLAFTSKISQTSYGKDLLLLYQDKVIDQHSVGFQIVRSMDRKGYRELNELRLFEGSSVSFAANPEARTTGIKSLYLNPQKITEKIDNISRCLKSGKYTDETFIQLEVFMRQLQALAEHNNKEVAATKIAPEPAQKSAAVITRRVEQLQSLNALFKQHY